MMTDNQQWHIPSSTMQLSANEVHVWQASLEMPAPVVRYLQQILSIEEVAKAKRFYFERDRRHWIVARGLLKTILGRYLRVDPRQLRFCYNAYGKPSLELPKHSIPLQFNVSHSCELALYAFTLAHEVGVDVEHMCSNIDYKELATYSFSPLEVAELLALPVSARQQAFFNCWTRKEAYIKARGKGLSIPLDQFDVSLKPGEPATLLNSREDPQEITRWSFHELAPNADYAGALVVEGTEGYINCWQWQEMYFL